MKRPDEKPKSEIPLPGAKLWLNLSGQAVKMSENRILQNILKNLRKGRQGVWV
jgi:hypothetical protein